MNNVRKILVAIAALAVLATACSADDAGDDDPALVPGEPKPATELEVSLGAIVDETGTPALGAAAFSGEGTLEAAVVGIRNRSLDTPASTDDQFHLGSNTKAMTTALVARLAEQGRAVTFDTTMPQAFPELDVHELFADVTIGQLLGHVGGAPEGVPDVDEDFLSLPVQEQRRLGAELVLTDAPEVAPGTTHLYSNLGYVIVAAALESATGESWEELMRAEVFDPLGMQSCGFGEPGSADSDTQPSGHNAAGDPSRDANPPVLDPAGGVHCSMADWGDFLSELLRAWDGKSEFLNEASMADLMQPFDGVEVPGSDGFQAAMGWLVTAGPNGPVYWHNGSNTLWYSEAVLVPQIDRAIIGVSNEQATGTPAVSAAIGILAEMYPTNPSS